MPSYAQVSDVTSRLGRPLTADELTQAASLLDDAEIEIRDRIPDLDDKVAADPEYLKKVIKVESSAVVRLVRNPDGYTGETDGNYSYQLNWRLSTGDLQITDKDWALLGVAAAVGAVDVRPLTPYERRQAAIEAAGGVHPFILGWDYADPYEIGHPQGNEFVL